MKRNSICVYHSGILEKITALEKSIGVAKTELDRRLEGMNEFRRQLDKQASEFITKNEVNLRMEKMDLRFNGIEDKLNTLQNEISEKRGSRKWSDWLIMGIIAAIVSIIMLVISTKMGL